VNLTVRTDLGLRILLILAANPDTELSTSDIAKAFGLSVHHTQKIGKVLTRLGWVRTTRGRHGGLTLNVPPGELRIDAVVRALEPDFAMAACFDGAKDRTPCKLTGACELASALDQALEAFFGVLGKYTLADVATSMHGRSLATPLVQITRKARRRA
jgi:Rrf2 family protein